MDEVPFHIVLYEPQIPPNTGSIARTCAATGAKLHLVGPMGFSVDEKQVRRAGLDYWPHVNLSQYPSWDAFLGCAEAEGLKRFHIFSSKASEVYSKPHFQKGDVLLFGREDKGLPQDLVIPQYIEARWLTVPIRKKNVRSLNLSVCVGVVLFEALRQIAWAQSDTDALLKKFQTRDVRAKIVQEVLVNGESPNPSGAADSALLGGDVREHLLSQIASLRPGRSTLSQVEAFDSKPSLIRDKGPMKVLAYRIESDPGSDYYDAFLSFQDGILVQVERPVSPKGMKSSVIHERFGAPTKVEKKARKGALPARTLLLYPKLGKTFIKNDRTQKIVSVIEYLPQK